MVIYNFFYMIFVLITMSILFSGCTFENKVNSAKATVSQLQTHETNGNSIEEVITSIIDETNLVYKIRRVINPSFQEFT